MTITVSPSQLARIVQAAIKSRRPLLIQGPPGIGKTDIVSQGVKAAKAGMLISHAVTSDPTDFKGIPWPDSDKRTANFIPLGELAQAMKVKSPTVWFFDDFGQSPPTVQAATMQLVLARRINGHTIPDEVSFIVATNRRGDKAASHGIIEPVKSRFTIVELATKLHDFSDWYVKENLPPEVLAFVRARPDLLHDFHPTMEIENSPCPRTWHKVAEWLQDGIDADLQLPVVAGCVGAGAAGEFKAFLDTIHNMPNPDSILMNPKMGKIPTEPSILFALCAALAYRAKRATAKALYIYAARLAESPNRAEFAVLLVKDMLRRDESLANVPEFSKLVSHGKFGQLLGLAAAK